MNFDELMQDFVASLFFFRFNEIFRDKSLIKGFITFLYGVKFIFAVHKMLLGY